MTGMLWAAGLTAGFIDSMVGGGGLITLPALMLRLGISPSAIGTNKVAAAAATLAAVAVYGYHRRMPWRAALGFAACVCPGSILGAMLSPRVLAPLYPALLWLGTGLCLATVIFKSRIAVFKPAAAESGKFTLSPWAAGLGFLIGFYDGAWGPGGGTFMFLALFYATPLGLVGSMAAAKIANLSSSLFALAMYAAQGYVHWSLGALFSLSLAGGALAGASLAIQHAERVVLPLLVIVTSLLLWRLVL